MKNEKSESMNKTEIDLMRVKTAADAVRALNAGEREFLAAYLRVTTPEAAAVLAASPTAPAVAVAAPAHRPDPRGHYKCAVCGKVLPTRRGRSVHQSQAHPEERPAQLKLTPPKGA